MALYKVGYRSSVYKDLRSIPKTERSKILKRIESLAVNPRPYSCEKLTSQNKYRVRQGDYRIIYTIIDNELTIWVVKVGHRKDVYRVSEEKEKFTAGNSKEKNNKASYI
jgi:mRNA interferase RelE/StbE